jgi:hypothetical protein
MSEAKLIIGYEGGANNADMQMSLARLTKEGVYKDLSTIIIVPALNTVATKAASSWWNLMTPPNGKVVKLFTVGCEVGAAYSQTIEQILAHPELSKFRYICCIEADNTVPPDGLIKLLQKMEDHPEYSCISGLYWTKGGNQDGSGNWVGAGVPQIWGDPKDPVLNFRPQPPVPGQLVECCGLGQGFCVFRLDVFKDEKLRKPWFQTTADTTSGCFSQDLFFWSDARKHGHRCAVACDVLVGHVDMVSGFVW